MPAPKGSASAGPGARRDRHQSRAARAKKHNLVDDPQVIAGWSPAQAGQAPAAILAAANTGARLARPGAPCPRAR